MTLTFKMQEPAAGRFRKLRYTGTCNQETLDKAKEMLSEQFLLFCRLCRHSKHNVH